MITARDSFGPWRPDIDLAERLARLRSLRAIARLCLGPRGEAFTESLRRAETAAGESNRRCVSSMPLRRSTGGRCSRALPP